MLHNIPQELRDLPQWVVATGRPTEDDPQGKAPRNPRTGYPASVTDPETWGTFDEATASGFALVGFVLTEEDPYCVVDLDDPTTTKVNGVTVTNTDKAQVAAIMARHDAIADSFNTYAEVSQSGKGIHIVCRASVPNGVRRNRVEVYSDTRYMIFTGHVFKASPITEQQARVTALFDEMATEQADKLDLDESAKSDLTDEQVYSTAAGAANSAKFLRLWRGEWQGVPEWPSQSEADMALFLMLAFYSKENEQVRRMFKASALGKRDKATDGYINRTLVAARSELARKAQQQAELLSAVDLSQLIANRPASQKPPVKLKTPEKKPNPEIPFPNGLVGEIAEYIYASSILPVREISLAASVALMAGLVGRAYNISNTGLNHYVILLAKTGRGKEGAATGIDNLFSALEPTIPTIREYYGPAHFGSGQGIVRALEINPCFLSVLGEFGITLNQICSPHASTADEMSRKVLLNIYAKSGKNKSLAPSAYSDREKNTKSIKAPNLSILGESNPDTFFESIDTGTIATGLLPRFTIFEYDGPRVLENEEPAAAPPEPLLRNLSNLAVGVQQLRAFDKYIDVAKDAESEAIFKEFKTFIHNKINADESNVEVELWNRANLKALKLAALVAVGINWNTPVVNKHATEWAISLVRADIQRLSRKFQSGEIGVGDTKREYDVRNTIERFWRMSRDARLDNRCPEALCDTADYVPLSYIKQYARKLKSFKVNERGGENRMLQDTISSMVEVGALKTAHCSAGMGYVKGPSW